MAWDYDRARRRIGGLMESVPAVKAERFSEDYMPRYRVLAETARTSGSPLSDRPLFNLRTNESVIVDAVHVYANLINYNEIRLADGKETEDSHARALSFLHLHYSACDRVVENCGAQRVDFHDGRMHAVVIEPAGGNNEGIRVAKAVVLTEQLRQLSDLASRNFRANDYGTEYRFGIDTGVCVAINSGRASEPEPLFLGSSANHAAKLAVGTTPGIYLSDRAQAALETSSIETASNLYEGLIDGRPVFRLNESTIASTEKLSTRATKRLEELLEDWRKDFIGDPKQLVSTSVDFVFHVHTLPLKSIDYSQLMPSNSIRMGMVSIFADLDRYAAYIDGAMNDPQRLGNAVRNLHVIRGEWANVIQRDFEGRKVRFIGDCVHGILASGKGTDVDDVDTVRQAVHCAGGLRSSFSICQDQLVDADGLGLAIGIEFGPTPVTRLGVRGERSVRVASSVARTASEKEQQRCNGNETAIGLTAYAAASQDAKVLFGQSRKCSNLDYDTAVQGVPSALSTPATVASGKDDQFRAHCGVGV